ncbi:MAG: DoxX family protein [Balneolaceae bacterium]
MENQKVIFAPASWALFFARIILGLLFLMTGWFKVFGMGAMAHARQLFVEAYADNWIPEWLLWFTGFVIPYLEVAAGILLVIGLRTKTAAITVGFILVLVTYGHLLQEPFFDITTHILPRTLLLLFVLFFIEKDTLSIDYFINKRKKKSNN